MKRLKFFSVMLATLLILSSFGVSCAFKQESSSGLPPEFDVVGEAWNILLEDHVDKDKLDAEKLSRAAIEGMVQAVGDPYTAYLDSDTYRLQLEMLKGSYSGIGAHIAIREGQLTIIAPVSGSPAERGGVKAGDRILEINGESTSGMTLTEAVLKIQGPPDTSVKLLVLHKGDTEPIEMEITRAEIELESVFWEMRDDIAYIKLSHFTERTNGELTLALEDILSRDVAGIVLDLRGNPGGLLSAAVDSASQFLAEGVVANVIDGEGKYTALRVKPGGLATELPLIVLVDEGSASASEILAGALQDHGRAKLAGSTTFGKGSVGTIRQLRDGSALCVTIARWLTPGGKPIEGVGLTPDFVIELEGSDLVDWAVDYFGSQAGMPVSVRCESFLKI